MSAYECRLTYRSRAARITSDSDSLRFYPASKVERRAPALKKPNRAPSSKWDAEVRRLVKRSGSVPRFVEHRSIACGKTHHFRPQLRFATPDLTFITPGVAVFLDGCYWHGCPDCYPTRVGCRNDAENALGMAARGWTVLRFWEHEGPAHAARLIESYFSGGTR